MPACRRPSPSLGHAAGRSWNHIARWLSGYHDRPPLGRDLPTRQVPDRLWWTAHRRQLSMETAGVEPASAVAQRMASTSVAGALVSPSARLAGGVAEGQLPKSFPGSAEADFAGLACCLIPVIPAAGERGPRPQAWFLIRPRGRTRESPHLWFSGVFYEAAPDLGSQPPPRTDRVEACRPRECAVSV